MFSLFIVVKLNINCNFYQKKDNLMKIINDNKYQHIFHSLLSKMC